MKNLKKVLSLALAFAMVLGLLVVGSAETQDVTELADWDQVTNKEDAILLNALNIMQGDDDGFRPNDPILRSEVAKMLSVAMWGGKNTPELYADGNPGAYTDVDTTAWYMGYINYMFVTKLMVGFEGKFEPGENVTGYELLKMCLVALGYDPKDENMPLEGAGWAMNTMALATAAGFDSLIEGTTVTKWGDPIDRMNAAIIITNMIWRDIVWYDATTGMLTNTNAAGAATTFAAEYLKVTEDTSKNYVLAANLAGSYTPTGAGAAPTALTDDQIADGYNAILWDGSNYVETILTSDDLCDLGVSVTVYTKDGKFLAASVDPWTEVAPIYNAAFAITNTDGLTLNANILSNNVITYQDTDANGKIDMTTTITYGTPTKVAEVIETENFGTIYQVGSTKWIARTMDKANTDLTAGFIPAGDFGAEKDDYIVYTSYENALGEDVYYGYTLTAAEGKVTRNVAADLTNYVEQTIAIDGVSYTVSGFPTATGDAIAFGSEGTFYTYENGKVAHFNKTATPETSATYAIVWDAGYEEVGSDTGVDGKVSYMMEVKVTLEDNTTAVYELGSITDTDGSVYTKMTAANASKEVTIEGLKKDGKTKAELTGQTLINHLGDNSIWQYVIDSKDANKIHLVEIAQTMDNTTIKAVTGTTILGGTTYAVETTISFVQSISDAGVESWAVVKGTGIVGQIKDDAVVKTHNSAYYGTNEKADYVIVLKDDKKTADTSVKGLYYIIDNHGEVDKVNGALVYEVEYYIGETGEVVTEKVYTNATAGEIYTSLDQGKFGGQTTLNPTGFITYVQSDLIEINTYKSDLVTEDTSTTYQLTKDTEYHLIDGSSSTGIDYEDIDVQTPTEWVDTDADKTVDTKTYLVGIIGDSTGKIATHVVVFVAPQKAK